MSTRIDNLYRPVAVRRCDYAPVERPLTPEEAVHQAEACQNCGIPFCHGAGCPLGNEIPDVNSRVAAGDWRGAWELLRRTACFPEFTGRICPALCEGACTAGIDGDAVTIRQLEKAVVETAFARGWVHPEIPAPDSGRRVAVIGSGPAGLAAARELALAGHAVTVFEKEAAPGGLLRYGIPDFKLEKAVVDRRIDLLRQEGVLFECDTEIGRDLSGGYLARHFDAVVAASGAPRPRDLEIPGRELKGVHFALEFLRGQNRALAGEIPALPVDAARRNAVVIGGGDTGSDCVGTALRQGAVSVLQLELMPEPPPARSESTPWPAWPYLKRTSSSHREGGERRWSVQTRRFLGVDGRLTGLETVAVEWETGPGGKPFRFREIPGSEEIIPADLALLALGFTAPPREALAEQLGLDPAPGRGIFWCGDAAKGASLAVRAIDDGRRTAWEVNHYLDGGEA